MVSHLVTCDTELALWQQAFKVEMLTGGSRGQGEPNCEDFERPYNGL